MVEQKKKLRLEELQVESFVTQSGGNPDTIRAGASVYGDCWYSSRCTNGRWCSDHSICNMEQCRILGSQEYC
jgi:hypothetical protein